LAIEVTRRARIVICVLSTAVVSACVHAPPRQAAPQAAVTLPASAAERPAAQPPASDRTATDSADSPYPQTDTASPATESGALTPEQPTPVVGLTPAQYADLFDRMRVGFKLEDPHETAQSRAIEQQLAWYIANPDYLERAFGRSELYLYHIVTELEARGMPVELALLPVVESAFEPYAYSRSSAAGLWQFIPDTGSRFGLRQDWWYDGRRDVVESTRAALDYLQSLHDEFNGDWLLAVAAYNCGEAAVERAVEINQGAGRPIDFWNLKLPKETRAYVPKLLAMKRLVADPESNGLVFSPIPNQPYFARVDTKGQIDLRVAAEVAGVTAEEVYELNPAYHRWATDPAGPHLLLLPVDGAQVFTQNIGQLTDDERMHATHYSVHHGDSVASLARKFHTTVNVIRELNELPTGPLTVGMDLRVPSANVELPPKVVLAAARVDGRVRSARRPHLHVVRQGDSLWAIARRTGMDVNKLAAMNGMHPGDTLRAGQRLRLSRSGRGSEVTAPSVRRVTYTVRSGDTLAQIARLFQVSVSQILAWNGIGSHSAIVPGQKLTIRVVGRGS
jgi:membrane-bound lytic murein transglycosylase D